MRAPSDAGRRILSKRLCNRIVPVHWPAGERPFDRSANRFVLALAWARHIKLSRNIVYVFRCENVNDLFVFVDHLFLRTVEYSLRLDYPHSRFKFLVV